MVVEAIDDGVVTVLVVVCCSWVNCFQVLCELMLSVEQRRREWRASGFKNLGSVWDDESQASMVSILGKSTGGRSRSASPTTDLVSARHASSVSDTADPDILHFFEDLAHDESRFELWSLSGSDADHSELLALQEFVQRSEEEAAAASSVVVAPSATSVVTGQGNSIASTNENGENTDNELMNTISNEEVAVVDSNDAAKDLFSSDTETMFECLMSEDIGDIKMATAVICSVIESSYCVC